MQITGDLNDEYLIMSMISRHEPLPDNARFCGMICGFVEFSKTVQLMAKSSEFLDELQCFVHDLSSDG